MFFSRGVLLSASPLERQKQKGWKHLRGGKFPRQLLVARMGSVRIGLLPALTRLSAAFTPGAVHRTSPGQGSAKGLSPAVFPTSLLLQGIPLKLCLTPGRCPISKESVCAKHTVEVRVPPNLWLSGAPSEGEL